MDKPLIHYRFDSQGKCSNSPRAWHPGSEAMTQVVQQYSVSYSTVTATYRYTFTVLPGGTPYPANYSATRPHSRPTRVREWGHHLPWCIPRVLLTGSASNLWLLPSRRHSSGAKRQYAPSAFLSCPDINRARATQRNRSKSLRRKQARRGKTAAAMAALASTAGAAACGAQSFAPLASSPQVYPKPFPGVTFIPASSWEGGACALQRVFSVAAYSLPPTLRWSWSVIRPLALAPLSPWARVSGRRGGIAQCRRQV